MNGVHSNIYQIYRHFKIQKESAAKAVTSKDPEVQRNLMRVLPHYGKHTGFLSLMYQKATQTAFDADIGLNSFAHKLNQKIGRG